MGREPEPRGIPGLRAWAAVEEQEEKSPPETQEETQRRRWLCRSSGAHASGGLSEGASGSHWEGKCGKDPKTCPIHRCGSRLTKCHFSGMREHESQIGVG